MPSLLWIHRLTFFIRCSPVLKRFISLFILVALAVSLVGCSEVNEFTCAELTLSLPDGYTERERPDGVNMLLSDGSNTVTLRRISFSDAYKEGIPSGYSASLFAEYFLEESDIDGKLESYKNTPYYTYYVTKDGLKLFCLASFFRTPYAYFIILFATRAELEEREKAVYFAAIDSIKIEIVEEG